MILGLRRALGTGPPTGSVLMTVFVPSKDREGRPVDQEYWRDEALGLFAMLFRGATAFPPGRGAWRDDVRGNLLFEEVVIVISYASRSLVTPEALRSLRRFLHRLGREARQGEIGLVVGEEYHGITSFDSE